MAKKEKEKKENPLDKMTAKNCANSPLQRRGTGATR